MPTPIENLTQNVNASTQQTVLQAVADDATARQQAADKPSAINAIVDNADQQAKLNFFGGIPGDATAEDLLTSVNAVIDKVSEDVAVIDELNTSESAIRKLLCRREGFDPANFADLDAVAADVSLVQDLSVRKAATDIITHANKAYNAISANDRATREMMCHPAGLDATIFVDVADVASNTSAMTDITESAQASRAMAAVPLAMQEVAASQAAMQEVAASQAARNAVFVSQAAMQEVAASQTAMQELVASQTAMQEVAVSQAAMKEIADSQTAMSEVANSQTSMSEVANSQTAMQEVANSQAAVGEILSAPDSNLENTIADSSIASSAFDSSNLKKSGNGSWSDAKFPPDNSNVPNNRMIITSNNTSGNRGTAMSISGVGSVNDSNRVFIGNANLVGGGEGGFASLSMSYVDD